MDVHVSIYRSLASRQVITAFHRLSAHHGNADARVVFMIFDKFFEYLVEEITNVAPPLSSLVWGEETCRLSPAGPAVWALDEPFVPNPAPVGQKFPPELSAEEQKRVRRSHLQLF